MRSELSFAAIAYRALVTMIRNLHCIIGPVENQSSI